MSPASRRAAAMTDISEPGAFGLAGERGGCVGYRKAYHDCTAGLALSMASMSEILMYTRRLTFAARNFPVLIRRMIVCSDASSISAAVAMDTVSLDGEANPEYGRRRSMVAGMGKRTSILVRLAYSRPDGQMKIFRLPKEWLKGRT